MENFHECNILFLYRQKKIKKNTLKISTCKIYFFIYIAGNGKAPVEQKVLYYLSLEIREKLNMEQHFQLNYIKEKKLNENDFDFLIR